MSVACRQLFERNVSSGMGHTILYFGSFNPPHNGHAAIAKYVLDKGLCDRVWLVVSPRNPFKATSELAPAADRLAMARIAAREADAQGRVQACGIEFDLPLPSYTVNTLDALKARYPDERFSVLMGADAAAGFGRWRDWQRIARDYNIYVYPRLGARPVSEPGMRFIMLEDAPELDFSATDVRRRKEDGGNVRDMVPGGVDEYMEKHGLWTCTNASKTK